jgi:hypothetical protein
MCELRRGQRLVGGAVIAHAPEPTIAIAIRRIMA